MTSRLKILAKKGVDNLSAEEGLYVLEKIKQAKSLRQYNTMHKIAGLFGGESVFRVLSPMIVQEAYNKLVGFAMEMPLSDEEELRDEVLDPQMGPAANGLRAYFTALSLAVSRSVARRLNRGDSPEEVTAAIDVIVTRSNNDLFPLLLDIVAGGYIAGGSNFNQIASVPAQIGLSFNLLNQPAVDYVRSETERLVAQISRTTHRILDDIVRDGVAEGLSASEIARRIRGLDGFDNGLFGRDINGRDRADRIAARELNHRYSEGLLAVGRQFDEEEGLRTEKRWRDSNDQKVRPLHKTLGATGWVPIDDVYAGGISPGSEPNCRCYLQIRVVVDD